LREVGVKKWLWIILIWIAATLACSLSPSSTAEGDQRPVLREDRPVIVFLAPQQGNRYRAGTEIWLHAEARDLGGKLQRVEFIDTFDQIISTTTAQNPQGDEQIVALAPWQSSMAQTHLLKAIAVRTDGVESSTELSIEIVAAPTTPTATINPIPLTTPTLMPTPEGGLSPTPNTEAALTGTVNVSSLNVRAAPSQSAAVLQAFVQGNTVEIVGRSVDSVWYAIRLPGDNFGWVFAQYVTVTGDTSNLPVVAAP
jgi:hypothetical protein